MVSNGLYSINESQPSPVAVTCAAKRLQLQLENGSGEPVLLYWEYQRIRLSQVSNTLIAELPGYPLQSVHTENPELKACLKRKVAAYQSGIRRVLTPARWTALRIVSIAIAIFGLLYFWLLPLLADRIAANMPRRYEVQLGEAIWSNMAPGLEIDELRSHQAQDFFKQLNIPTDYPIEISVVQEPLANALALPGGHIVLYDGLLDQLQAYPELAAVLVHEFTHVQQRHATRALCRAYAGALFISIIGGDAGGMVGELGKQVADLQQLSYSRSLEKKADLNGLQLLTERHIDADGFVRLFKLLEKQAQSTQQPVPEWISSHPDLKRRINYIRNDTLYKNQNAAPDRLLQQKFNALQH